MKPPGWCRWLLAPALVAATVGMGDRPPLEMSKAVVCKKVEGYERFIPLPDASLTGEDKLNVYFRPLNYRVDPVEKPSAGRRFRARFVEDCRIRRKGEKLVLMKKDRLLEHDATFEEANYRIYLLNNIGLKGLPPGDYELDIVLHDDLEPGASAAQTVGFTIVPTPKFDATKDDGGDEAGRPPAPAPDPKKAKGKAKAKPKG